MLRLSHTSSASLLCCFWVLRSFFPLAFIFSHNPCEQLQQLAHTHTHTNCNNRSSYIPSLSFFTCAWTFSYAITRTQFLCWLRKKMHQNSDSFIDSTKDSECLLMRASSCCVTQKPLYTMPAQLILSSYLHVCIIWFPLLSYSLCLWLVAIFPALFKA